MLRLDNEIYDGEIENCPFCGKEAILHRNIDENVDSFHYRAFYIVRCSDIWCVGHDMNVWEYTPERAVARWNRRPDNNTRLTNFSRFKTCSEAAYHYLKEVLEPSFKANPPEFKKGPSDLFSWALFVDWLFSKRKDKNP